MVTIGFLMPTKRGSWLSVKITSFAPRSTAAGERETGSVQFKRVDATNVCYVSAYIHTYMNMQASVG